MTKLSHLGRIDLHFYLSDSRMTVAASYSSNPDSSVSSAYFTVVDLACGGGSPCNLISLGATTFLRRSLSSLAKSCRSRSISACRRDRFCSAWLAFTLASREA
mmetsp:Transcript_17557/g.36456  ORF Transcript_17557/g.36456 Transcript_17557/m.36456 type:complete len:103 (-) Transcript_17557:411-719(-)